MTISDEDFRRWCKDPHADSVLSFELDYVAEEGGLPVTRTLYVSDKPYRRSDNRYRAIIQDVSDFDKGLGGDRFGVYASSYGRLLLRSPDGEHDDILDFAMDGSEWRCRLGDTSWPISDHRIMDVGTIARVASANISDISIELQDAGLLLNKSIGGSVLIGGTGPNADKPRSFNFGLVRQVECFLVDQSANLWSHSDTGDNTIALDVQVRLESVGFTDNGDGTITLDATPPRSGVVTATVLALPPDVDPSETWRHLTSDAMDVAVGLRSGLIAEDRYAGPHATFTVGDDQDFPLGFNVTDTQKTPDFLTALCASGLCSWAFNRFNQFTYLRIRPNDIADLPMVPFDIRKDDIDEDVEPDLEHELPKYYRLRGYCDKNWKLTDDVAGDVIESDEYTQKTRVGLAVEQDDAVGETYADKPENYDRSMVLSPMLETWFSGDDDDDNNREHFKGTYLEVARANGLPWLEKVKQVRVGMEFFDKELGDVARLIFDRWGYDDGALTQVIRIRKLHTQRKIEFTLLRRRLSTPYPEGWERITTGDDADTESAFVFDSESKPVVVPPVPGRPPVIFPPITIPELMGVSWMRNEPSAPSESDPYVDRLASSSADLVNGAGTDTGLYKLRRLAFTRDSKYMVVGDPSDQSGGGDSSHSGIVRVFKRAAGGSYSQVATLRPSSGTYFAFGSNVDISDDYIIAVSSQDSSDDWYVFESSGTDTWSQAFNASQGGSSHFLRVCKNAANKRLLIGLNGGAEIWADSGSGWVQKQALSNSGHGGTATIRDGAVSKNGMFVALLNDCQVNSGAFVEFWTTSDFITWSNDQSIAVGATDGSGGGKAQALFGCSIAMSYDGRVIAAGVDGVHRGGSFVGGVYVLQAIGTALGPDSGNSSHGTFAQTALLTGINGNNSGFGHAMAMSLDGQFLCIGASAAGASGQGAAYAVNRLQSISGEIAVNAGGARGYAWTNPHPSESGFGFGDSIAMPSNGSIIAIAGVDANNNNVSTVRVFTQTLDDLLTGITNDDWASPIVLNGTVGAGPINVDPVKMIAASLEPDEASLVTGGGNLRSLWYKITPAGNATLSFDVLQSTTALDPFYTGGPYLDTLIQVFTGASLAGLSDLAGGDGDDNGSSGQPDEFLSALSVAVTSGTDYYIQVLCYDSSDVPLLRVRYELTP